MTKRLTITKPDDWHVHFRDNHALADTVSATALHFARALAMPNLLPPLTSVETISAYRDRVIKAIPAKLDFTPYFTFYLNETVSPDSLKTAASIPHILGAKLYPAGATTNSELGAKSLKSLYPLLSLMQENQLVLQIHGESVLGDIFLREAQFIEEELRSLIRNFPRLRIVLEHISTEAAVDFVSQSTDLVAATITPQHLLFNRNDLLSGGIKPHYYCLPILKHPDDQKAIQRAALSGNPKFFAGTDSAPHTRLSKESACGCAGIYSAPYALSLYTEFFDNAGKLEALNDFVSSFGALFYQLPMNQEQIELVRQPQTIAFDLPFGEDRVVPIASGKVISWSVNGQA